MYMMASAFIASFDFRLCDRDGNEVSTVAAAVDRNQHATHKPEPTVYLKYEPR
jgi:hypothetical protein